MEPSVHHRLATSALLSAALVVAPAAAAFAAGTPGLDARTKAQARAAAHHLEHALNAHRSVVVGGKLVSVTADDPLTTDVNEGQVVLTVHGGRFKLLRGTDVTVVVDSIAKVTRDGAATLADLVAGDHVVARLTGVYLKVSKDSNAKWVLEGTATAKRVAASPAADTSDSADAADSAPTSDTPTS
jgi:hypothetical protein